MFQLQMWSEVRLFLFVWVQDKDGSQADLAKTGWKFRFSDEASFKLVGLGARGSLVVFIIRRFNRNVHKSTALTDIIQTVS